MFNSRFNCNLLIGYCISCIITYLFFIMWPLKSSDKEVNETKIEQSSDTKDDLESAHIEKIDASIDTIATSIDNLPVSWFVWLAATTASMAGLLFGYDTGIISGVLVVLGNSLDGRPATSSEKEMITSLCSGGAFIGAIFAGNTADRVRQPLP